MSSTVYPGSRISKLPKLLRRPALALRTLLGWDHDFGYVFQAEGMATIHYSPFLHDPGWDQLYWQMSERWFTGQRLDARWRMWILTTCARQCAELPGSFAEFGVYRAGCAWMILSTCPRLRPEQRFYLFDTFGGIPYTNLTEHERMAGYGGRLEDTSAEYVADYLSPWRGTVQFVVGDVFETMPRTETGPLALVHLDLNASRPTLAALEYLYPRLLPSGMLVMDDYAIPVYDEQRRLIDGFFANKPERPLALPTGQGLAVKMGQCA